MPPNNSYQASKYTSHSMLLDEEELDAMLPHGIYMIMGKLLTNPEISRSDLLVSMKEGRIDTVGFAFTNDHYDLFEVKERGCIARPKLPVIEIKQFCFSLNSNGNFLEGVFGKDSIDFGVTFSYPTLFMDKDKNIINTRKYFQESDAFKQIREFKRKHTKPASFYFRGNEIKGSFRIGKKALVLAKNKIASNPELILETDNG